MANFGSVLLVNRSPAPAVNYWTYAMIQALSMGNLGVSIPFMALVRVVEAYEKLY